MSYSITDSNSQTHPGMSKSFTGLARFASSTPIDAMIDLLKRSMNAPWFLDAREVVALNYMIAHGTTTDMVQNDVASLGSEPLTGPATAEVIQFGFSKAVQILEDKGTVYYDPASPHYAWRIDMTHYAAFSS